ncbi:chemotaxis protein CheW [Thermovibrio ammonificans]|jgi:purine-binding chemotaxis protein CheW|uniref:CheW protein n=1 Tax=Thermovibrio ammonificans (strain DSM 15698 / JCM 12110 / HB-1) TaxID=648996 RepID=E8T6M9_THEA1|nr:chemotaxis protein CheW [Thermovibrio ammonificans]ADU96813.1 CheW protein [Thermovibrio ammonificans HB-1]
MSNEEKKEINIVGVEELIGEIHEKEVQVIAFKLENELVSVPIEEVVEITSNRDVTPVPKAPSYVIGVMNLRGKIVPVVNLKEHLGIKFTIPEDIYKKNKIVIIDTPKGEVGVIVDKIIGSIKFPESDILPEPIGTIGIDVKFIQGVVQLEKDLLIILNIETIFNQEE